MYFLNYFKKQPNGNNNNIDNNNRIRNVFNNVFNNNNNIEKEDHFNNYNNDIEDNNSDSELNIGNLTLPNYVLIKVINYLLFSNFGEIITLQYENDINGSFNNFLKLSMVSKSWEQYVIPNLNFPYIKLKNGYDCKVLNRWLTKGLYKTPLIGIKNIDIEFPNVVSGESVLEYSNLTKIKKHIEFDKIHFSNSLAFIETNEIQNHLTTFITNHNIKELNFSVLPSIKNPLPLNLIPTIKLSDLTLCKNLQHISLKNQLLSCERILSFLVELYPQLISLDLSNNRIGIDYSDVFHETLSSAVCLKSLKLGSNVLKSNINYILPILQNFQYLNYLDISENYINEDSSNSISDFITNINHLEYLNLSRNTFDQLSINKIMISIASNKSINQLVLSELKCFSPTLLNDLVQTTTSLKQLEISANKLDDPSAFFNSMKQNKSIKSLNLSYCSIQHLDYQSLSEYLNSSQCNLTKLTLLRVFTDSIPSNVLFKQIYNINELDISINYINQNDCKEFAEFLKTNTSITKLNLKRNKIGSSISYIFNSLKYNSTLTHLDLSSNIIDLVSLDYEFVTKNNTLISLNLSDNIIENYEIEEFVYNIQSSNSITHLDISTNKYNGDINFTNKYKKPKLQEVRVNLFMKHNKGLKKIARVIKYENDPHYQYTAYMKDDYNTMYSTKKPVKRAGY